MFTMYDTHANWSLFSCQKPFVFPAKVQTPTEFNKSKISHDMYNYILGLYYLQSFKKFSAVVSKELCLQKATDRQKTICLPTKVMGIHNYTHNKAGNLYRFPSGYLPLLSSDGAPVYSLSLL